jgi:acyl-coenzyme A thioesterase PaaI-like protein
MIKIVNPFKGNPPEHYPCFGCSPHNPIGMKLEFYQQGDSLFAEWLPDSNFEGFKGVLHGGIQATLMDEIASWFIYSQIGTAGVTKSMDVQYHFPVRVNEEPILIKANLVEERDNHEVVIFTEIQHKSKVCASATVTYFTFPEHIAKAKYHYPGKEAFFEQ